MSVGFLLLLLGGLTLLGFLAGRQRALASVKGDARDLHSLPGYYGYMVALFTAAPAFLLMVLWLLIQPVIVERNVTTMIQPEDNVDGSTRDLVMDDVRRIAEVIDTLIASGSASEADLAALVAAPEALKDRLSAAGVALAAPISAHIAEAATEYRAEVGLGRALMAVSVLSLAVAGFLLAVWRVSPCLLYTSRRG
mgnify:CR=1 FL=1